MRVALFHDLPPGGALRFVREVTRRSAAEHHYTLFTIHDGERSLDVPATVDQVVDGVHDFRPVVVEPAVGAVPRLAKRVTANRRIAAMIDEGHFDVALVHPSRVTQAPPLLGFLDRTPSIYYAHEVRRQSFERGYLPFAERPGIVGAARSSLRGAWNGWLGRLDAFGVERATGVATNSCYSAETIARCYGRDATVVHPGVDATRFAISDERAVPCTVLSVGALDPTKGHDLAVEALGLLPRRIRPRLTIVYERGDDRFGVALAARAAALDVDLELRHGVSEESLAHAYSSSVATLALARLEPFGLTPLESMASGTPVVAVCQGGYRETVVPGCNGVLVEPNAQAVAAGIDEAQRIAACGRAARIRETVVERWSWDRTTSGVHAALAAVAGTP